MALTKYRLGGSFIAAALLATLVVFAAMHAAYTAPVPQPANNASLLAPAAAFGPPSGQVVFCEQYNSKAIPCHFIPDQNRCSSGYICTRTSTYKFDNCPIYTCVKTVVKTNPTLTLQSSTVQQGSSDKITGVPSPSTDSIEIEVDGAVVAGPQTGTISYTLYGINYQTGTYTVSANDITSGTSSSATLTVTAPPPLTCSNACHSYGYIVDAGNCPSSCPAAQNGCSANQWSCSGTPVSQAGCGLLPPGLAANITANAPWYCPINQQIYNAWKGDLPIALIVVSIAFLIAGAIFAVGAGFKNDRIRNYGIGEMYEATASAILVALFLYVSAVVFGLLPSAIIGPINPYATALNLMTNTISAAENVYTSLYHLYYSFRVLSSLGVSLIIPSVNYVTNISSLLLSAPQFYWDVLVIEPTYVIASFITDGILALYAEYNLIVFFSIAAIPAFLIPGIILRAIIPTRALGGMMVALAMGFYFVMPTLFAVAYYFTAPNTTTLLNDAALQLSRYSLQSSTFNTQINPSSPIVTQISGVQTAMSGFWLLILFYPTLIVAVTYAFVVQVSDIIGGASRMGGKIRGFI